MQKTEGGLVVVENDEKLTVPGDGKDGIVPVEELLTPMKEVVPERAPGAIESDQAKPNRADRRAAMRMTKQKGNTKKKSKPRKKR